jgi:hypothetical protein
MTKKYIFVLCPPFQGSTIIVNLLDSSEKVSTLLSQNVWAGESQWLIQKHGDPIYKSKRWDPEYNMNMDILKNILDIYSDKDASIFVEKSPPNICRAKKIQDYFSNFGEVYFIISIRNPYSTKYSAEKWVKYAEYQKNNIEILNNTIVTSYEDICLNLNNFISKIKEKLPELDDIHNHDNINLKNERLKKIHSQYTNRILDKESKNFILKKNLDLLNYFGYELIE